MKVDALWCASIAALLAPFTSLLVAHRTKTGNPPTPLTEQLVAAIYRRAGGYGLAALPFLTITTGYVYVSSLDAFFKECGNGVRQPEGLRGQGEAVLGG